MDARDRYPEDCLCWRDDGTEEGFCTAMGNTCTQWCLEDEEEDEP